MQQSGPIKIAILGGDLLVSQALEVALQGVGYDARFLNGSFTDKPAELLDEEVRLVIFAPRMSTERRKAFLSRVRGSPATAGVPVLELVTASDASQNGHGELVGLVLWPCSTEELKREIEVALFNGAGPKVRSR